MAGTNCSTCIFSSWQDQTQIGCSLDRLDKYPNVQVLNEEKNGFYYVLTDNICPAKRNKEWLSEHPQKPDVVVRQEVYPKLQLLLMIDSLTSEWIDFFASADLSKYSAVDIMLFLPESDYIKSIGYLLRYANIFIHACTNDKDWQINYLVRKDCQFYLTVDKPRSDEINKWPDKLDNYINVECKSVLMTYNKDIIDEEYLFLNNRLVYTPLHISLGGYGSQSIPEKIRIYCYNEDRIDLIVEVDEILNATSNT